MGDIAAGVVFWRLRGRAAGAVTTGYGPTWEFFVGPRSAPWDTSLGFRLDMNGDGFVDVVAGAPQGGIARNGNLYFFPGSVAGVATTPTVTLEGEQLTAPIGGRFVSAGDLDGDGYGDLLAVTSQHVYRALGSPDGPQRLDPLPLGGDGLEPFALEIGDVDRDGYADVLVNSFPGFNRTMICFGSALRPGCGSTRDVRLSPEGERLGFADINGDGYSDVLLGFNAQVFALLGRAGGPAPSPTLEFETDVPVSLLGTSLAGNGDVNGDGFGDVVIGQSWVEVGRTGRVYVYLGGTCPRGAPDAVIVGPPGQSADFGAGASIAGDFDGDGYADLFAPGYNAGPAAFVLRGGPAGISATPTGTIPGLDRAIGTVVVGDLNGDGYADAIMDGFDGVQVYLGSASGLPSTRSMVIPPPRAGIGFGHAI